MINRLLFFTILAALGFTGCKPAAPKEGAPTVTVTILPYRYFVEQLAGTHFEINVLVPPGANHHAYDPSPRQLQDLEKSKIMFYNGHLGFEQTWIPGIRSNHPDLKMVDLSSQADLIVIEEGEGSHDHDAAEGEHDHSHEGPDPHYWLSVPEAKSFSVVMAQALMEADPSCKPIVTENLKKLHSRLDSLHLAYQAKLEKLNRRSFLIFHPALNYIARDYGLTQHSMEEGGKEPSASHFRELVEIAVREQVNTVFIQKEYDKENAETLAREINARIVVIDPLSADWMKEMDRIIMEMEAMTR